MTIIWTEEEGEMWRCGGGGDLGVGDRELTETMLVPKRGNSPFVDGSSPFMNGYLNMNGAFFVVPSIDGTELCCVQT